MRTGAAVDVVIGAPPDRSDASAHVIPPATAYEKALAEVLAEVVSAEPLSVESHFFHDLGADSMVMARFCARVRKRDDLPSVSMKDIYRTPTIRALAASFPPAPPAPAPAVPASDAPAGLEAAMAAVLAQVLNVEEVAVQSHFFHDLGADSMVMARFCARVRKRDDLPSVSMKDIYRTPTIRALAASFPPSASTAATSTLGAPAPDADAPAAIEAAMAAVLAQVLEVERVTVESHFFDDLGADSMVMAHFCARVRKRDDLPSVSMKDIYRTPTIRGLVSTLAPAPTPVASSSPAASASGPKGSSAPVATAAAASKPAVNHDLIEPVSTGTYWTCGILQLLIFLGYSYVVGAVGLLGIDRISAATGPVETYLRSVEIGGALFVGMCVLPILAKWLLVGRWQQQEIQVWSLNYVRFWTVKTLIRMNPLVLFFAGTPLYVCYLRALGAKIGPGVVILSRSVPVCTDLLSIGRGTIIRKDAVLNCYRARAGRIETGPVTIGENVLISESTVIDIHTSLGDDTQLAHRSSLHAGQSIPAGERWHGSPGRATHVDFRTVDAADCGTSRRALYSILQLLTVVLVNVPLAIGGLAIVIATFPGGAAFLDLGPDAVGSWAFYEHLLIASAVFFFGGVLVSIGFVYAVPRLLNLFLTPDKVYPLYGFHYSIQRTIARITNVKLLTALFGDSSFIVHYLKGLGYDLSDVEQTGSNFGAGVKHETPFLVSVGRGTMVADGLSVMNADFSSTSFRVTRTTIGPRNFLGNSIAYPSRGKTGDNCLLATKVMVPIDGKVREGVGLLGSPSFEIPRSVMRDSSFDHLKTGHELRRLLSRKDNKNLRTMAVFLLARWFHLFGATVIVLVGAQFDGILGALALGLSSVLVVVFSIFYGIFVERAAMRFRRLTPQFCSIYDPYFWRHERLWKLIAHPRMLNGTPFKVWAWRLCGVRIGKMVFDDGVGIPERTLVTIGDHCTLNVGSEIQGHSQEDGAFKSDYISIGAGCTLGIGSLVHYGVTMGEHVELDPDSFVMKGEEIRPYSRWAGNPAGELTATEAEGLSISKERSSGRHRRSAGRRAIGPEVSRPATAHRVTIPASGAGVARHRRDHRERGARHRAAQHVNQPGHGPYDHEPVLTGKHAAR